MPQSERFLSRANVHRALWTLLIALVSFGGGLLYRQYHGKEKVVVATPEDGAKPLVVRVERLPGDPESKSQARIEELMAEVRSLKRPESKLDVRRTRSSSFNSPFIPSFELPASVKGYKHAKLAGFGEASCPPKGMARGDAVLIQLFLEAGINVNELSPVFVRIDRPKDKENNEEVLEQQFVLVTGLNSFRISHELPLGEYKLLVGFYARAELSREYPNFYSIECPLLVR